MKKKIQIGDTHDKRTISPFNGTLWDMHIAKRIKRTVYM